ncbi:leucine-rich repeat domain-containing protein [Lachnospiraceae bacterium 29-84]
MKKWKKLLAGLLAMAMTLSGMSGYGDEVKAANVSGDFKYEVSEDWDGVIITGYTGNNEEVEIPSDIDGEKVVRIGYRAFSDCSRLKGVTISNSVTSISYGAFLGCSGLENIKVEEGNPKYDSRDSCNAIVERESEALVLGCKNTVIPNSVTSIRKYAFFDCSGLTGITIPTHVISIEYEAFSGCSGLENIISRGRESQIRQQG